MKNNKKILKNLQVNPRKRYNLLRQLRTGGTLVLKVSAKKIVEPSKIVYRKQVSEACEVFSFEEYKDKQGNIYCLVPESQSVAFGNLVFRDYSKYSDLLEVLK